MVANGLQIQSVQFGLFNKFMEDIFMERNDVVVLNNERFITKFYYNSDANQMGENR